MQIFVRLFATVCLLALALQTHAQEVSVAQNEVASDLPTVQPVAETEKSGKKPKKEVKPYVSPYYNYDDDRDGVPNGRDKCPKTPRGSKVTPFGCPIDTDFDGMYDYEDKCIDVPGPKENFGCPWGDKDNDGFTDNVDKCPDVPGVERYQGCPVPPKKDTDGDTVFDDLDLCPEVPGVVANRGCPEIKAEEKAALKKAFENLLFETGKDVIKASSFRALDDLARVLINNPQAHLHLEGHTDDVGEEEANLLLSQNRSVSVKRYLADKGVDQDRITTDGFGESRPVAGNDTVKGKSLNRRVEMVIRYE